MMRGACGVERRMARCGEKRTNDGGGEVLVNDAQRAFLPALPDGESSGTISCCRNSGRSFRPMHHSTPMKAVAIEILHASIASSSMPAACCVETRDPAVSEPDADLLNERTQALGFEIRHIADSSAGAHGLLQ
jgi:hypothetical protein